MPVLDEISGYILSNSTRFKAGGSTGTKVPLWKSTLPPDQANTSIGLFEAGGPGPVYTHNGTLYTERPSLQVISRSTSYATARDNAEHIYTLLGAVTNVLVAKTTSTGDTTYVSITPVQSPFDMGQDAEERNLISCNYIAEKEQS